MLKVELINYNEKYADEIDSIERLEWGVNNGGIKTEISDNFVIQLAKYENEIVGTIYGKVIGDLFYLEVIIIKPEYQHQHIGSLLMDYIIRYAKEHHLTNILAEGVCTNGHLNVEGLMKKYQFQEMLRIKSYWGSRYPEYICNACGKQPCECTGVIFVKKIS